MKNLYLFLVCFYAVNVQAIDIHVNNSGQANSYSSVSAALSASNNGDRIFISPYQIYVEDLIIDKSLTISSAVIGNDFEIGGKVTVNAFPNMDLRIVGGVFSDSLVANTGTATLNNMADIYLVESFFNREIIFNDYVKSHLLFLIGGSSNIFIKHGEIIGCNISNRTINISDGPIYNIGDTIKIIGNRIKAISYDNDDNYFNFYNNIISNGTGNYNCCNRAINIAKFIYNQNFENLIINNEIKACSSFGSSSWYCSTSGIVTIVSQNADNIILKNNIIRPASFSNNFNGLEFDDQNQFSKPKSFFNFYNGSFDAELVIGNQYGLPNSDEGDPSIEYYDLDLTRNDIGPYGGPYSLENFFPTDSANGRARIYNLNIPSEIWSGNISVQSKGVHTK